MFYYFVNTYIYIPLLLHCNNVYIWRKTTLILLTFIHFNLSWSIYRKLKWINVKSLYVVADIYQPQYICYICMRGSQDQCTTAHRKLYKFLRTYAFSNATVLFKLSNTTHFLSPEQTQIYSTMYNVHGSDIINIGIRYPVICHTFEGLLELSIFKLVC